MSEHKLHVSCWSPHKKFSVMLNIRQKLSCKFESVDKVAKKQNVKRQKKGNHNVEGSNQQSRETVVGTSASITVSSVTTLNSTF